MPKTLHTYCAQAADNYGESLRTNWVQQHQAVQHVGKYPISYTGYTPVLPLLAHRLFSKIISVSRRVIPTIHNTYKNKEQVIFHFIIIGAGGRSAVNEQLST